MEKMKFNSVVTSIADYINQLGSAEIIDAISYSAPSLQYFATQSGVNEETDIHLFETTGELMDGKSCDSSANNTTFTYTDRKLKPCYFKQESIDCVTALYGKWMAYNARYGATTEEIPFAQRMVEALRNNVAENLENFIWNGKTINGVNYKGLANIIEDASEGSHKLYCTSTGTVYDQVVSIIKNAPNKSRRKTEIFMSEENMIALKEILLAKDFRLYDLNFTNGTANGTVDETTIKMPVYGNLVHAVSGLNGNDKVYGLVNEHVIYGTSNDADRTDILSYFDPATEKHILRCKFIGCVQIAYPSETLVAYKQDAPAE